MSDDSRFEVVKCYDEDIRLRYKTTELNVLIVLNYIIKLFNKQHKFAKYI